MFSRKNKRRDELRNKPVPPAWIDILQRNMQMFMLLSDEDRNELFGHIHVLLDEKSFEGCGGLSLTDEMKVSIAGQAAVLLLHRDTDYFPSLASILVYPSAYFAPTEHMDAGVITEGTEDRAGETWEGGSLVLSWEDVLGISPEDMVKPGGNGHDTIPDAADRDHLLPDEEGFYTAYNVVLHEFAHQLDLENGALDGMPRIEDDTIRQNWSIVFQEGLDRMRRDLDAGLGPALDDYAVTDPVEFFAVAVEAFFETPLELEHDFTDVYSALRDYFVQDPREWTA